MTTQTHAASLKAVVSANFLVSQGLMVGPRFAKEVPGTDTGKGVTLTDEVPATCLGFGTPADVSG